MAIFERQEDPKEPFSRAKVFAPSEEGATEAAVTSLTPSPNSESLLAVMRSGGSYALRAFPLAQYDALGAEGDHFAPVMGHVADPGPVGSLTDQAGCVLRPITVTIGSDAVARVWNFLTHRCEVSAQLADEPTWCVWGAGGVSWASPVTQALPPPFQRVAASGGLHPAAWLQGQGPHPQRAVPRPARLPRVALQALPRPRLLPRRPPLRRRIRHRHQRVRHAQPAAEALIHR